MLLGNVAPWRGRLLEIGCGEGANLFHLTSNGDRTAYALDSSTDKLRFGRRQMPGVRWIGGDALRLPFRDQSFDAVLIRDLLHHVPSRDRALREAARVLRETGRLTILEGNGKTLLGQVFGRLFRHERGLLESSLESVRSAVAAVPVLDVEQAELVDPAPLYRLLLHYRFGLPALSRSGLVCAGLEMLQRGCSRLGSRGGYILVVAVRPDAELPRPLD
jgi:SAM-dependent methyltransferase